MRNVFDVVAGIISVILGGLVEHEMYFDKAGIYIGEVFSTWVIASMVIFFAIMYLADLYDMNHTKNKVHHARKRYRDETAWIRNNKYDYKIEKPSNFEQQKIKEPEIKEGLRNPATKSD